MQGALHGTCTEIGVVALFGEEGHGVVVHAERDALSLETMRHGGDVDAHDLFDFAAAEGVEHDDVVDAVDKLRPQTGQRRARWRKAGRGESCHELFARTLAVVVALRCILGREEVGGHDDDGVLEVDRPTLVVGEASVVEHLQEDVEDVGVCLFDFVEEHHRVRFATHGLGELTAFVITDVSRRGTDEARSREFLLIFAHVDARHHVLVVEEAFGQCLCQFGLTDTRRSEEYERTDGAFRVLESGAAAAHGVGHGFDGFVLTDDAGVELVFEMQEFFALALEHAGDGDARPAAHHVGDVVGRDLFFHHGFGALALEEGVVEFGDLTFQFLQAAVANLGHLAVVAFAFGTVGLELELLDFLLVLLDLGQNLTLTFPFAFEVVFLFLERLDFLIEGGEFRIVAAVGSGIGLAANGFALNLELAEAARDLIELFGLRIALHAELGGSFVHEVDGLVGEEAVGDVAMREGDGGDEGIVLNAHMVVVLVALFESAQDGDGVFGRGFVDEHRLETTLEGFVLLEILLVLLEGGSTDAAEFAACQGWLEDVGRVHGTFALAGAHEGVDFVDEEDDAPFGGGHLVDHALEALFKFALVLGTGHEGTHVEREDAFVAEVFGHVAASDALCQTFYNGGFTRTGFTDEDGVVFRAAREDLQDAADLFVATDDGV